MIMNTAATLWGKESYIEISVKQTFFVQIAENINIQGKGTFYPFEKIFVCSYIQKYANVEEN